MDRCCQTCTHWGDGDQAFKLAGGFRYCLRNREKKRLNPKAPDAGRWCAAHHPKAATHAENPA